MSNFSLTFRGGGEKCSNTQNTRLVTALRSRFKVDLGEFRHGTFIVDGTVLVSGRQTALRVCEAHRRLLIADGVDCLRLSAPVDAGCSFFLYSLSVGNGRRSSGCGPAVAGNVPRFRIVATARHRRSVVESAPASDSRTPCERSVDAASAARTCCVGIRRDVASNYFSLS